MLRQDVWGFSDGYTVAIGDITFTKVNNRGFIDIRNRYLAFKNKAPFTDCISKINNVLISNAEDLHVVTPMYILLEYSKNYRKTTGSLWNYYRDEPNNPPLDPLVGNNAPTVNYNADLITNSSLSKLKTSITGNPGANQMQHQMQIKKMVGILSKKKQRLRKILKLLLD